MVAYIVVLCNHWSDFREKSRHLTTIYMRFKKLREKFRKGGVKKDSMPCNKPRRSPRPNKTKVVKACQNGEEKIVHFGDPNMRIKKSNPDRKKSYCARSKGIGKLKNKLSANYWSRKAWNC